MLIIPPPKPRKVRPPMSAVRPAVPTGLALSLLAVFYSADGYVTLKFDRPIDVSAYDGSGLFVNDEQDTGYLYDGSGGAVVLDDQMVIVTLVQRGTASGSGIELSAPANTGIVAVDDGGTWAGVSDLTIPFE